MKNNYTVHENSYLHEKYYYIKHKSGLDIYVFPKDLSVSYALFGTKYGSVDNRFRLKGEKDYTVVPDGIAHYLEHKMFENEDGQDTFARFAKTGACANAYTSFNMTAYLFSCTEKLYDSLDILLDYVTKPYFTPETVAKEQGIIGQEIRMGEDNPERAILFGMLKALYAKNNVRLEIAGTVESISHITANILYKCYNTFYNLHNMSLVVCGQADPDKVIEAADKILPIQSDPGIESVGEPETDEVAMKRWVKKMQVSKTMFDIGIKNNHIAQDPRERMKITAGMSILTDMMFGRTSSFYNTLYEEGLISPSFDAWSINCRQHSYTSISGESEKPEEVYDRFIKYIENLKQDGLDRAAFERCKRVALAGFVKSFDSTDDIANNFLSYVFDDGDMLDYADVLSEIDFEYITSMLFDMFNEKYYAMAVVEPLDA
ncbi:MAG: pitrilysin family protein [Eubacteriales bacterium]